MPDRRDRSNDPIGRPPRVSVVIAAYNSSARLLCAIESIRRQAFADLEILVIGDAATDDSGDRLQALGDERIRWENLERNWGEQSVPSNRGLELARGDIVLFLNQDDLYLAGHIARCIELMEAQSADVVWSHT
jgi:glycosyltransferase involved in cell wall biosynthesis